jgi:hypothetical protein
VRGPKRRSHTDAAPAAGTMVMVAHEDLLLLVPACCRGSRHYNSIILSSILGLFVIVSFYSTTVQTRVLR